MNFRALVLLALASSGCLDLSLPPQPGVGAPGVVTGRAVWQRPGRLTPEGASGASIYLLGSSVAAAANTDGRFVLDGVTSAEGTLLIRFDADRDGVPERQRTFVLADLGAARGRTVSMGDVSLSQPSLVAGRVLRGDQLAGDAHGGTAVFIPGLPLATLTAADAEFQLEGVVEGPVQVAAVRAGYEASLSSPLLVRGGEEVRLSPTTLVPTSASMAGALRGRVVGLDGTGLGGVLVDVGSATTTTDGEGAWRISGLSVGRYDVVFSRADKRSAALFSVLVAGPDELLLPNVVLAPGGGAGPSLVEDVLGEHDAGVDAGFDGGADAGVDAGVDAGQMVTIGATPATMQVGEQHQLTTTTTATPDFWTWRAVPEGLVRFDNPSSASPTITALDAGTVTITVEALFTPDTVTDSVEIEVLAALNPQFTLTTDAPGGKLSLDVGQQATVQAFISPTPVNATYVWEIPAIGVASIVGPQDRPSVTIEGTAEGLVGLALTVTADGTRVVLRPNIQLDVRGVDAGVDAGFDAGAMTATFTITDAGITPLGLWLETSDEVMSVSGELISGASVSGPVRNNLARRRLSVVFDSPPTPGSQVSFSASSIVLTDGGVRRQPAMIFDVPGFTFQNATLVPGAGQDFHPGIAFSPSGAVTTGRLSGTTSCLSSCFFANSPGGTFTDEVTLQAVAPWRAAVNAGAIVQAWASTTQSYTLTPNGVWSTSPNLPPGPTFADGMELRALGPFTGTGVQIFRENATSWTFDEDAGAVASGTLSWAEAVALTTAPNTTRKLVLAIGSPAGSVRVFEKLGGATSWGEPTGLNTVSGATTGHLAMTPVGDVLAINNAANSPSFYGRSPGGSWAPLLFAIAGAITVVELVAVGSHVYALLLETTGTPYLLTLTPLGNQQSITLPSLPCPVTSAALATSDFGDLSIAVSLNCTSVYSLQRLDLGTH